MERINSPQWTLFGSLIAYLALYLSSLPSNPSFSRIAQTREAISLFHVTLQTILSAICLREHQAAFVTRGGKERSIPAAGISLPIIRTRSTFAQCITAIEAGYLMQDSIVLLQAYRTRDNLPRIKGWNFLHLGLHHFGLGSLLLILQYYIAKQEEKGILIIIALHLMNASSIFGTIRWFLINFRPSSQRLILATTAMYLATFAIFRVYLVFWVLRRYGQQQGPSVWAAIHHLPATCKVGTGTILLVNSIWLVTGVRSFAARLAGRRSMK